MSNLSENKDPFEEFDHPCKGTCSGWKQGFEKGAKYKQEKLNKIIPETNLPNCTKEELQKMLMFSWEVDSDNQGVILSLQERLENAMEVIEFYSKGGHPNMDIWQHESLGYFTGKRARIFIAEQERKLKHES